MYHTRSNDARYEQPSRVRSSGVASVQHLERTTRKRRRRCLLRDWKKIILHPSCARARRLDTQASGSCRGCAAKDCTDPLRRTVRQFNGGSITMLPLNYHECACSGNELPSLCCIYQGGPQWNYLCTQVQVHFDDQRWHWRYPALVDGQWAASRSLSWSRPSAMLVEIASINLTCAILNHYQYYELARRSCTSILFNVSSFSTTMALKHEHIR